MCLLASVWAAAASAEVSACLNQGKKEFLADYWGEARKTFTHCLTLDENNEETLLSLGGVCLTQEDLPAARKYFLQALGQMKRSSPYLSYTYSMLGDISLKQGKNRESLAYYNRSLNFNAANVNSLVGKGIVLEIQDDKLSAARAYETALAVEPLNVIARKHLIALEPLYFNDKQVLEALKQRYAVLPDKEDVSEEDRKLFRRIHRAEQRGGIDYLKKHFAQMPPGYIVTLFKDTGISREMLTLNGYNVLQKRIAQDAVNVFLKMGIPTQSIFDLRDLKGNKIFVDNTLTPRGMYVYAEALQNRKAFLLPHEEVPPTQQYMDLVEERVKELYDSGYAEISLAELSFIEQKTNCSENTLRRRMGLYILPLSRRDKRYFVFAQQPQNAVQGIPWYYVAWYRSQRDPNIEIPSNAIINRYAYYRDFKICGASSGELLID